jgi:hypothetical protein
MDSYHPGTECLDPIQKLALLEKRKAGSGAYDAERARRELDLVNQFMSLSAIKKNSKSCPGALAWLPGAGAVPLGPAAALRERRIVRFGPLLVEAAW